MTISHAQAALSIQARYVGLWRFLPHRFRLGAFALLSGTLLGAMLEVLCLSLLATLMSVITPGGVPTSPWLQTLNQVFGGSSSIGTEAVRLIALCAVAFGAKNALLGGVAWMEATFTFHLQAHIADASLTRTLGRPYEDVAGRPPAEHLNLMTADLTAVVFYLVLPTLTLLSEALLMVAVIGFLFWAEPMLTLVVVLAVGGSAVVLMRWSRRTVATLGLRRQELEDERIHRLRQVFNHLREVYVYRAARESAAHARVGMADLARVYRVFQMMATGPRFVFEVVLIAVLLAAVFTGLKTEGNAALMVSVGILAASGFRLLIGANRLVMSWQGIRFAQPAMERILTALQAPAQAAAPAGPARVLPSPQSITLRNVVYRYEPGSKPVLADVELELRRGRMIGIQGGSGAGKTTLLELLCGLRAPTAGQILLGGTPSLAPTRQLPDLVAYVGQAAAVFAESVRRNVAYGRADAEIDDGKIWAALEQAHLGTFVRTLPHGLDTVLHGPNGGLSGGQAQRLALARALYAERSFLLLDEPTSALDPGTEEDVVLNLVELAANRSLLVVSHRPRPLQACDVVYEIRDGRLALVRAEQPKTGSRIAAT